MTDSIKSVKELADQLHVTKQTIFHNAKLMNITLEKINNVSHVTAEQEKLLSERINKNKERFNSNVTFNNNEYSDPINSIELYKQQIDMLLQQKESDNRQIEKLSNLLEQQQQLLQNQQSLQLQSNEKIKQLESLLEQKQEKQSNNSNVEAFYKDLKDNQTSDRPVTKKSGLLSRLLRR